MVPGVNAGMLAENKDEDVVIVPAVVVVDAFSRPPRTESPPTDNRQTVSNTGIRYRSSSLLLLRRHTIHSRSDIDSATSTGGTTIRRQLLVLSQCCFWHPPQTRIYTVLTNNGHMRIV